MEKTDKSHLGRMLGVILFSRINIVSAFRTTYPFLPVISRGLGVSFQTGSLLVTVRSLAGLFGLVAGPVGDRIGYRWTMVVGLILFGFGVALVGWLPVFWIAVVAFTLIGMAKATYDPAMRAYLSTHVPYNRRGRAIGGAELSWSGGWFVGAPVCGYLIGRFGWQSPWLVMAALVIPSVGATFFLPSSSEAATKAGQRVVSNPFVSFLRTPRVLPALLMSLVICFASEHFFVVYGAWMEHVFGLGPTALGTVSIVVGISELTGELGVVVFTDSFGKERSVTFGILLTVLFFVVVPLLEFHLRFTVVGLGLLFVSFEFLIVSNTVWLSELVPDRRSTMMASLFATSEVGRAIGAFVGPRLWGATESLLVQGIVSAMGMIVALLIGKFMVFEEALPSSARCSGSEGGDR